MTSIEIIATLFGILCVWFTIKRNILCWPTGLIQIILFVYIFLEAKLYSDVLLHVIYIFLSIYGWYTWSSGSQHDSLNVTSLSKKEGKIFLFLSIVFSMLLGYVMDNFTDASAAYPDASITILSLVAQWLITRKKIETWYYWILVDLIAIFVYFNKGLYFTTGLYLVFLIMAVLGLHQWRNSHTDKNSYNLHNF